MNDVKSFRELLSGSFATVDQDIASGDKVENGGNISRRSFLADFEVEKLVEALRKTVANQPQN